MQSVLVIKNVSVKLSSSINGGYIRDQERVCQTLQLHLCREYWWSRTCLSNSSAPSMESVLVIKNVCVKLFSFFNGGCIGDQERVCKTLQFLQWSVYRWSRTCLSKSSASLMDVYSWSRTCLSNSPASLMDGIFLTKTVSVKRFTFFNEGYIHDQERVCFLKLFNFFNGGIIDDQERVCETIQFLQWRVFWWPRTCLSNSSVSSVEGVFVIKNVSVKLFSFIYGGSIGDQERVSQTPSALPQWRVY